MKKMLDAINCSPKVNYTQIANRVFDDKNLSLKAKQILCQLLRNRKGWKSYLTVIEKNSTDGQSSIRSGIKELEEQGYLWRVSCSPKDANFIKESFWAYTDKPFSFKLKKHLAMLDKRKLQVSPRSIKRMKDIISLNVENQHLANRTLIRLIYNNTKNNSKELFDSKESTKKSNKVSCKSQSRKIVKSKNIVKEKVVKEKKIEIELNEQAKSLYKIWTDCGGKQFYTAVKAKENLNRFAKSMLSSGVNPYSTIINDAELRLKKWTTEEFESCVKRFFASNVNDKTNLTDFIYQKAYNGTMKARSRLLESFKAEQNKFEFKGEQGTVAKYIFTFYKNQIGNPEEVNPGVFMNLAKNISELEKSFAVNPSFMHPENQLWYKYMQYIKAEFETNSNFIPAYMSSKNFVDKFKINAQKNGALLKRR